MSELKGRVAIVGAGARGSSLLAVLLNEPGVTVVGVADSAPHAPGIERALRSGVPVYTGVRELLSAVPDIVINATSSERVSAELAAHKPQRTEIVEEKSVRLFCGILEQQGQAQRDARALLAEMQELYRIGVSLTSADRLEEALDTLLIEALRTISAPSGSIALYDEASEMLTLKAFRGFSPAFSTATHWRRRRGGMTDHILSKRVPTVIHDVEQVPFIDNTVLLNEGVKSILAVPLFAGDTVIGILYIDDFSVRAWTAREAEFLTLLGIQAAYAIEKFRLIATLSETRNYLQSVLDNSADIIMTTNVEGRIVEFNRGAVRVLGYPREEMVGAKAEALWVKPQERQRILALLASSQEYVSNYETQLKTKDGRQIDISLTLSAIRDVSGAVVGTVGISRDITERKRLERVLEERNRELLELNEKLEERVSERTADLERANSELERSNKLKSQFIATMSHELRTPLNSILGFSELLMDEVYDPLTDRQKRYVGNIYNSGSHLLQLISNVLDIAKIESGKLELCHESFPVSQAIAEVDAVIRSLALKKKQQLAVTVSSPIPPLTADRVKIKQILYNLLANAVKFTPEGGSISVEARAVKGGELPPGLSALDGVAGTADFLQITVSDTGIGIKPEDRERIFSEFEQGDSSFSRHYEGTGLGLALTKRLVELHGGDIAVTSEEGKGSSFIVALPLKAAEHAAAITEPADNGMRQECVPLPEAGVGRRCPAPLILVVEDNPSTAEMLTLYLVRGGYRVARAATGEEAVDRARDLRPFAILLDIMLPGKDGWEALQEIKSDPATKDISVIICSVNDNKELGFALGASDYLVKPVDRLTLLKKLDELNLTSRRSRKHVNILCIDDHEETRELLISILEPAGCNVITASSGREGVEKALAYKPDLVILDLMMPEMDGFEVVHILKNNPAVTDIPILILTAKDLTVDDRFRLAGKIESFVQKSHFTKEDLLMYIRDLEVTYPAKAGLLDEVSGLFDHCYFQLRLAQDVCRAARHKSTFTTIVLDLDHFTEYIKAHGIAKANNCIKKIADFLRRSLRGSDTVVRYGIDEFAVILSNTVKESAVTVAKRFLSHIEAYPFYGERIMPRGKITASVAVVNYPQDASSPEEIIFTAHRMLRDAKEQGGSRVEVHGERA